MQVQAVEEAAVLPWPVSASLDSALVKPDLAMSLLAAHMPGIDILRGLAVMAVVVYHGMAYQAPHLPWQNPFVVWLYELTAWGWLGVNLFFVISGFLITGILDDTLDRPNYYERFYLRRALRILPAYLAVLLLAWATRFVTPNYMVVCVLFLANMPGLFLRHGYLFYGPFWSLAVEEQFYLLWPTLYRRLKRGGMLVVSLGLLVACPTLRALAFTHLLHTGDPLSKTWMIADNLALGAVLAIVLRWPGVTLRQFAIVGWTLFAAGSSGLAALFAAHCMDAQNTLRNSFGLSCYFLVCGSLIVLMLCLFRHRRMPRWMGVLVFFGDISYGLYLVHLLLLQIYDRKFGTGFQSNWRLMLLRFAVANGCAVVTAIASRRWFEDPILRMKSRIAAAR